MKGCEGSSTEHTRPSPAILARNWLHAGICKMGWRRNHWGWVITTCAGAAVSAACVYIATRREQQARGAPDSLASLCSFSLSNGPSPSVSPEPKSREDDACIRGGEHSIPAEAELSSICQLEQTEQAQEQVQAVTSPAGPVPAVQRKGAAEPETSGLVPGRAATGRSPGAVARGTASDSQVQQAQPSGGAAGVNAAAAAGAAAGAVVEQAKETTGLGPSVSGPKEAANAAGPLEAGTAAGEDVQQAVRLDSPAELSVPRTGAAPRSSGPGAAGPAAATATAEAVAEPVVAPAAALPPRALGSSAGGATAETETPPPPAAAAAVAGLAEPPGAGSGESAAAGAGDDASIGEVSEAGEAGSRRLSLDRLMGPRPLPVPLQAAPPGSEAAAPVSPGGTRSLSGQPGQLHETGLLPALLEGPGRGGAEELASPTSAAGRQGQGAKRPNINTAKPVPSLTTISTNTGVEHSLAVQYPDLSSSSSSSSAAAVALSLPAWCALLCERHCLSLRDISGEYGETTALSINCGTGGTSFELAQSFAHVLGLDSDPMLVLAAKELKESGELEYHLLAAPEHQNHQQQQQQEEEEGACQHEACQLLARVNPDVDRDKVRFWNYGLPELPPKLHVVDAVLVEAVEPRLQQGLRRILQQVPGLLKPSGTCVVVLPGQASAAATAAAVGGAQDRPGSKGSSELAASGAEPVDMAGASAMTAAEVRELLTGLGMVAVAEESFEYPVQGRPAGGLAHALVWYNAEQHAHT